MSFQELSVSALLAEVGVRVRVARLEHNMSQEELAKEAALSRSTVKRLESGTDSVSLSNLLSVLQVLGLVDSVIRVLPEVISENPERKRASRPRGR